MRCEDRITKMWLKVEFRCAGKIGWVDVQINAADIVALPVREFLDERIMEFVKQYEPAPVTH